MLFIIMHTDNPRLKSYSDIVRTGGGELDGIEYNPASAAKAHAESHNADRASDESSIYVVVSIGAQTKRLCK